MNSITMQALADEMRKIALNRWEQAAMSGELDAGDLQRLGPAGETVPKMLSAPSVAEGALRAPHTTDVGDVGRKRLRYMRDTLWGGPASGSSGVGELTPEQLERHRELQQHMGRRSLKSLGGIRANMPGAGPVTLPFGSHRPLVGDNAGMFIRQVAIDPTQVKLMTLPQVVQDRIPFHKLEANSVDKTLHRAVVEHEGGEKALFVGADASRKPKLMDRFLGRKQDPSIALPARPSSSHLGFTPLLEEKHVTWRDPEAQKIFAQVRQGNPDDAAMDALHRQFGGRPDSPIPMGGSSHAKIERRVAAMNPETTHAVLQRSKLAPAGMSFGMGVPSDELSQMRGLLAESIKNNIGDRGKLTQRLHNVVDRVVGTPRAIVSRAVDPSDVSGAIMKLRSMVRK
jgi:hypothetical protein